MEPNEKTAINETETGIEEINTGFKTVREITTFQYVITRITFMLFFLGDLLMVPLMSEYMMYRTALDYNQSDYATVMKQHKACIDSEDGQTDPEWDLIQEITSETVMYYNLAELLPTVPAVLLLGAWSDTVRRRVPLLKSPAIGNFICAGLFVMDYYIRFNSFVLLYTGAFFAGITGGSVTFFSGGATIIADTVPISGRTKELTILEATMSIGLGTSNIAAGYWIYTAGFQVIIFVLHFQHFTHCCILV